MAAVRLKIPVDTDDTEVTVTLDLDEIKKAMDGKTGKACVVISRQMGLVPLHVTPALEIPA